MTEQTKVLTYTRDFLLSFSNYHKFDSNIQAIFKNSSRYLTDKQIPVTVEKSRNLRQEPRKQEKFLTPNVVKSRWKTKDPLSPDPLSPTTKGTKPTTNGKSFVNDNDRQLRPNKENLENAPSYYSPKSKDSQTVTANTLAISEEVSKPESNKRRALESERPFEEVKISLTSPSPENLGSSPSVSSKVVPKSPGIQSDLSLSPKSPKSGSPKVVDEHQLEQRQKQVDYGHQTLGYLRYRLLVPKDKRSRDDPRTPKKSQACSKRSWDGQIKKWRRDLHQWDPEDPIAFMSWLESDFVIQMIRNNIGTELLDLLQKIKERQAKFENSSPANSPSPDSSPVPRVNQIHPQSNDDDLHKENVVRKLVF